MLNFFIMTCFNSLTDEQWITVHHLFDTGEYGKSRKHDRRVLIDAVFYIMRSGCKWRDLPKSYPHYKAVCSFYKRAKDKGLWEIMMEDLARLSRRSSVSIRLL